MDAYRKGTWSPEEDEALRTAVQRHGAHRWVVVCREVPGRTAKSCRLRWCNQLSPEVNHGRFTESEDRVIVEAHRRLGNQWVAIAKLLVGRTDNAVKNRWHAFLKHRNSPELPPPPPMGLSGAVQEPIMGNEPIAGREENVETELTLTLPGS